MVSGALFDIKLLITKDNHLKELYLEYCKKQQQEGLSDVLLSFRNEDP